MACTKRYMFTYKQHIKILFMINGNVSGFYFQTEIQKLNLGLSILAINQV